MCRRLNNLAPEAGEIQMLGLWHVLEVKFRRNHKILGLHSLHFDTGLHVRLYFMLGFVCY